MQLFFFGNSSNSFRSIKFWLFTKKKNSEKLEVIKGKTKQQQISNKKKKKQVASDAAGNYKEKGEDMEKIN